MVRSRGLDQQTNPGRIPLACGMAIGAAFAAALIGVAPAARADTEPDPFADLFGTAGINSWTTSADAYLIGSDPTLAASMDTSVDSFLLNVGSTAPFSFLAFVFDPSAFSMEPAGISYFLDGGVPLNSTGDFAMALDYLDYTSGIGEVQGIWFPGIWELSHLFEDLFGIGGL